MLLSFENAKSENPTKKTTARLCTGGRHGGFRRPVPESNSVSAAAAAVPSSLGRLELACKSAEHCISNVCISIFAKVHLVFIRALVGDAVGQRSDKNGRIRSHTPRVFQSSADQVTRVPRN